MFGHTSTHTHTKTGQEAPMLWIPLYDPLPGHLPTPRQHSQHLAENVIWPNDPSSTVTPSVSSYPQTSVQAYVVWLPCYQSMILTPNWECDLPMCLQLLTFLLLTRTNPTPLGTQQEKSPSRGLQDHLEQEAWTTVQGSVICVLWKHLSKEGGSKQGKPGESLCGPEWPVSITCTKRDIFLTSQHVPQTEQKEE